MKKKFILIVCLLAFAGTASFAQDTIYSAKKVKVVNLRINRKTGHAMQKWVTHEKLDSGYMVKESNGLYIINGVEMVPDNFKKQPESFMVKRNSVTPNKF